MDFKDLHESIKDFPKVISEGIDQTALGKRLGLTHLGKGIYADAADNKYTFNQQRQIFIGWKGVLKPSEEDLQASKEKPAEENVKVTLPETPSTTSLMVGNEQVQTKVYRQFDYKGFRFFEVSDPNTPRNLVISSTGKPFFQVDTHKSDKEISANIKVTLDKFGVDRYKEHFEKVSPAEKQDDEGEYIPPAPETVEERRKRNEDNLKVIQKHLSDGGEIQIPVNRKVTVYKKQHVDHFKVGKNTGKLKNAMGEDLSPSTLIYVMNGKTLGVANTRGIGVPLDEDDPGRIKNLEDYERQLKKYIGDKSQSNIDSKMTTAYEAIMGRIKDGLNISKEDEKFLKTYELLHSNKKPAGNAGKRRTIRTGK